MSIHFSHTTREAWSSIPGLPENYQGPVWKGTTASHVSAGFGHIVIQEYNTESFSLRKVLVRWKKPERIVCHYHYPAGMFSRVALDNSLHEYIKGAGEVHLKKEQFATLVGSKWTSVILAQKAGDHNFIDLSWSIAFLQDIIMNDPVLQASLQNICNGFADRLTGPPRQISQQMHQMLVELQQLDFSQTEAINRSAECVKKYFRWMLKESREEVSIRTAIKQSDWQQVNDAKVLIDTNPDKHFTIPEISLIVGMNEYKLKKLFPKVTGFKIDEYRKYQLCIKAAKKIMQLPDAPLKTFVEEAGYTSLTTFIRGFRKLCFCTPGELRDDTWDLSGVPTIQL